jgi:mono/diheme cytochrome c family protein
VARFIRDEKRTYPFVWLTIGGIFAASAAWAVYAELVTRVPWQKHQGAFYQMEAELSKQGLARADAQWKGLQSKLAAKTERKAQIEESMRTGEYATSRARLDQLNRDFAAAETGKTFGSSDLDEAYYYREIAEYARDQAAEKVRDVYHEETAQEGAKRANITVDNIYKDPPLPPRGDVTEKMYHLLSEIAKAKGHVDQIEAAINLAPNGRVQWALRQSEDAERAVIDRINVEMKHQKRVDDALAAMAAIDGPADPPLTESDAAKRVEERKRLRAQVCKDKADTRNCIQWIKLEPVDLELKAIDVELAKSRRVLTDAELRESNAQARANPKFKIDDLIHSLVGTFQIQQVVMHWIEQDRDVDLEQVDRCGTCHMGSDSSNYVAANLPRQFRTHPWRGTLFSTHPVDKFGCTSCHQGQGRATDELAHSGWHLEEKNNRERWHFAGDHYWEDPLLPIGILTKVVVDTNNDTFEVRVGKGAWEKVTIAHKNQEEHDRNPEIDAYYAEESEKPGAEKPHAVGEKSAESKTLFGELQEKLAAVVEKDAAVKAHFHAVVRKLDNRVQIGIEQNNADETIEAKETPTIALRFPKPELARLLGFNAAGTPAKQIVVATAPPSVPVRGEAMEQIDDKGRYHPPRGDLGLQVPDEYRNRFIEALPEVEAGCLKCHHSDTDLRQRASSAKYNVAKLAYEKAEVQRKKDPETYRREHDGSDELPAVPAEPTEVQNPVPTVSEGRALFKKLNCTGCHILDGYAWDRNSGPALDNVTAKVSPEWILQWIRNPRGWRAKTRMPNLWPKPLDTGSKRPLPPSAPEYQKWEAQMREETVAIASFLVERSDNPSVRPGATKDAKPMKADVKGYADVPGATIEKGKKAFESYGCQGCHARSDEDTAEEKLPEAWRSRERDIAPTLANMAGKTSADWIAYWVEEPSRYWHGTKMPNLRLSREEAASVGKYVASLASKPLNSADVAKEDVTLVTEQAKRLERVPCSNANGQLMTRVECGEKLIGYYGCFGCHNISGYEKSAPVAPELGGFAKKDITTLDFGYAIADHHLQTTETFATLKLDSPRIYRRDRIELKMADFDLSPREIRALVVFLKGLVANRPRTAFKPADHPEYAAALEGRQLVEDYNCRACHVIEGHGGDIDQFRQAQLSADAQARAPYLNGEGMRVQPEWLFSFLRDPGANGIRPWLHPEWAWGANVPEDKQALRMPTFNFSPEQVTAIVRYFASWDGQDYPYQAPKVNELSEQEKLYTLTHMNAADAANCLSCHYQGEFPVERGQSELGKMAPNFNNISKRLRPEWVKAWLLKPANWLPYTKMTGFWATVDRPKDAAMWPAESDPFLLAAPLDWKKVPVPPNMTAEQQATLVRDFLFTLSHDSVFPKAGEEADSPLVKKAAEMRSDKDESKGKDKDKAKAGAKQKKVGAVGGPARLSP